MAEINEGYNVRPNPGSGSQSSGTRKVREDERIRKAHGRLYGRGSTGLPAVQSVPVPSYKPVPRPRVISVPTTRITGSMPLQTGAEQRGEYLLPSGSEVRLGPNSMVGFGVAPPRQNVFQDLWNRMLGRGRVDYEGPSNVAGVRG